VNDSERCTIRLGDGRSLGYAAYGAREGRPVFYFTGGNSSRLEGRWFDAKATAHGVRLIVPDRPGFGLSDFQPGRRILDWADDVGELAGQLGIDRFALFGLSGGGPHVVAVVHASPERVSRAAIVSGLAPPEMPRRYTGMWLPVRVLFLLARRLPALHRVALRQMARFYSDPVKMRQQMIRGLPRPDRELVEARPEVIDVFSAAAREAHRNGIEGDAWEWQLYVRPWGFDLAALPLPVGLWYGSVDGNAPEAMGRYLAEKIPRATLRVVPDGGHFSTIHNHIDEIFEYLLSSP
jgi:pimeloyl-ACP methyl ester carboxylesterase